LLGGHCRSALSPIFQIPDFAKFHRRFSNSRFCKILQRRKTPHNRQNQAKPGVVSATAMR
jgi:hypothetical protein